jgi:hypothetical protein
LGGQALRLDLGKVAGNDHVAGAVVAAKLFDIRGDEEFVLKDENPQSVKQWHRAKSPWACLPEEAVMSAIGRPVI